MRHSLFIIAINYSLLCGFGAQAEELTLPFQGQIILKKNMQSIGDDCVARREWVEVEGLENPQAEQQINHSIRRIMTVGRKLPPQSCPGTLYDNRAYVTGTRDRWLGVETIVHHGPFFNGGGHESYFCSMYNVVTGKNENLMRYLNDFGKQWVAKAICDYHKDATYSYREIMCQDYHKVIAAASPSTVCLKDSGVEFDYHTGPRSAGDITVLIPEEKITEFFNFPANFDFSRSVKQGAQ